MTHDMLPKSKHISTQYKESGEGEPLVGGMPARDPSTGWKYDDG